MGASANFSVAVDRADRLVLRDDGPWNRHLTITNDAENVVKQVAARLGDRMLLYFDSDGELGELRVKAGKFAGFAPAPRE